MAETDDWEKRKEQIDMDHYEKMQFKERHGISRDWYIQLKQEAFNMLFKLSLPSLDPEHARLGSIMSEYHHIPDIIPFYIIESFIPESILKEDKVAIYFDFVANRGPSSIPVDKALMFNEEQWMENRDYDDHLYKAWVLLCDWTKQFFGGETTREQTREFWTNALKYYREKGQF